MTRQTLTALKSRPTHKNRVEVYLDGRLAFDLDASAAACLAEGQELSESRIRRLKEDDENKRCYRHGLKHLARRPRSEAQTRHFLEDKGYGDQAVDHALERLSEAGYLNDAAYARDWVALRQRRQPRSTYALGYELRQKGLGREIVSDVLKDIDNDTEARRALEKKWRQWRPHVPRQCRPKMMRFLLNRGFTHATSGAAIDWALKYLPD